MLHKPKLKYVFLTGVLIVLGQLGVASLSLAQGDTWTEKALMPTDRVALAASTLAGKIYAIGGRPDGTLLTEYDPATDTWTTKTDMPTPRFGLASGAIGKIYAIGGIPALGLMVQTVEAYSPQTDTWTPKADMPTERGFFSISVVDARIYAIGGSAVGPWSTHLRTVEVYDPLTNTWTQKADMPTARAYLSTSAVDGKIHAIGGALANKTMLTTVEVYDPATDTWKSKTPMPTARFGHATAVLDGKIYAIAGGTHTPSLGFTVVEAYDPVTDTWTTKADLPAPRAWLAASVANGKIYAFGGTTAGGNLHPPGVTTVYEYTPTAVTSVRDPFEEPNSPTEFALYPNFPNPFNPTTTIEFSLVKRSAVNLKVFNIVGKEVAMLVDEALSPGSYKVVFKATGLPSGLYFYRITAGGFAQTKKLMLLK